MKSIGPVNALYPMPTTLVGMTVNGKPNFLAVAHVGILNHGNPQYLTIGLHSGHYSNAGIKENKTFSMCIPSEDLMIKTDYCGIMTGKKTDKASLFTIFYGKTRTAPMIEECPVTMELSLKQILEYGEHEIFVGQLVDTYVSEDVFSRGSIDIDRVKPLLFDMAKKQYWSLGTALGQCWGAGKYLKKNIGKIG
jgi:flavin reductase (DIM6/NTAB) family NADH-FMN oxidoreductase RutF